MPTFTRPFNMSPFHRPDQGQRGRSHLSGRWPFCLFAFITLHENIDSDQALARLIPFGEAKVS
jgi:hypothetical protein